MDLNERVAKVKALCEQYEEKRNFLDEKEREVKEAAFACSELVKQISELIAPKNSFNYKGKKLVITSRTAKKTDGHQTHFFRGWDSQDEDSISIE